MTSELFKKSSSGDRKLTFCGWGYYFPRNVLEKKCIKSGGKSRLSLSFLASIVNDVRRKLTYGRNTLDCRNTSKKNARYCSRDYSTIKGWATLYLFG